jgi:hypothetical protein
MVYANELKALAAMKVTTTNIHLNSMARQLEGNIGKCTGGGSMTGGGRCGGPQSTGSINILSSQETYIYFIL